MFVWSSLNCIFLIVADWAFKWSDASQASRSVIGWKSCKRGWEIDLNAEPGSSSTWPVSLEMQLTHIMHGLLPAAPLAFHISIIAFSSMMVAFQWMHKWRLWSLKWTARPWRCGSHARHRCVMTPLKFPITCLMTLDRRRATGSQAYSQALDFRHSKKEIYTATVFRALSGCNTFPGVTSSWKTIISMGRPRSHPDNKRWKQWVLSKKKMNCWLRSEYLPWKTASVH